MLVTGVSLKLLKIFKAKDDIDASESELSTVSTKSEASKQFMS